MMGIIVGALVGAVGIGFGIWAWKHPRPVEGVLAVACQSTSLQVPRSKDIQMLYKGTAIDDPHLCTIRVTNTGPVEVFYKPSAEQKFCLTVIPDEKAPEAGIHLFKASEGQIQTIPAIVSEAEAAAYDPMEDVAVGLLPAVVSATPRISQEQVELDSVGFLKNGGVVIPVKEFLLKRGAYKEWSIFSEGQTVVRHAGLVAGARVIDSEWSKSSATSTVLAGELTLSAWPLSMTVRI